LYRPSNRKQLVLTTCITPLPAWAPPYLPANTAALQQTLASSRAFVINQFGLSAFVWEGGAYRPRTFNFYLFPRPSEGSDKRFVCQVGEAGQCSGSSGQLQSKLQSKAYPPHTAIYQQQRH
jgi:hypothetical protein